MILKENNKEIRNPEFFNMETHRFGSQLWIMFHSLEIRSKFSSGPSYSIFVIDTNKSKNWVKSIYLDQNMRLDDFSKFQQLANRVFRVSRDKDNKSIKGKVDLHTCREGVLMKQWNFVRKNKEDGEFEA